MLLRISFFLQHKRKWRYIFAAPSDTITVVHRALQESPKARDDLLVKGDALQYAKRRRVRTDTPLRAHARAREIIEEFRLTFHSSSCAVVAG
jgi:hypothetical protein